MAHLVPLYLECYRLPKGVQICLEHVSVHELKIKTYIVKKLFFKIFFKATGTPSPQIRRGHRGSTFSSVRLSQKATVNNPVRRNTTRVRGRSYRQKKVSIIYIEIIIFVNIFIIIFRVPPIIRLLHKLAVPIYHRSVASIRSKQQYRKVKMMHYSVYVIGSKTLNGNCLKTKEFYLYFIKVLSTI